MTLNSRHLKVLLSAIAGVVVSLFIFVQVQAQTGPIDVFTYFIPYTYLDLADQFDAAHSSNLIGANINTVISIAIDRDNTVIYYDHHEDGLEIDLTSPTQPSTEIHTGNAGDVLLFNDIVPNECNPPAYYCHDGGDALRAVGGTVSVALTVFPMSDPNDPNSTPGVWFAGSWELLPTIQWGTEYIIPVGQNVPRDGNGFGDVGLNVQAVQANTNITIDLNDGNPVTTITLGYGEQYTVVSGVNAGARVQASAPVQVQVFTGDPTQTGTLYEARAYTMLPRSSWSNDYLAPRSSDGDYWLYNPDTDPLNIQVETTGGVTNVIVPGQGVAKYPLVGLSGATGTRFTAQDGRPFFGLAALDGDYSQDWGYIFLPVDRLTSQVLVGFGVGDTSNYPNDPSSGDPQNQASRVYVTALTTTTVRVDYENDGIDDATYTISPLEEVDIIDPNDFNLTGALIYSADGTPIVAVWGQDESAIVAGTSLDVGTSIPPLASMDVQKIHEFVRDSDCTGTITLGDTVEFRIDYFNRSFVPLYDAYIIDILDPSLDYVPNSTIHNGTPVESTSFPFDLPGYQVADGNNPVAAWGSGFITFDTIVSATGTVTNSAVASSNDLHIGQQFATSSVTISTGSTVPAMEINTSLIDPPVGTTIVGGDVVTFGITITNTSGVTLTTLPVQFAFDETILSYLSAAPVSPDVTAANAISWPDLTTSLGDLPPDGTVELTVTIQVAQITSAISGTEVWTTVEEAERDDDLPPLICQGGDRVTISYVDPIITKRGDPDEASAGDSVYFSITVFNPVTQSVTAATGVLLIEPMPAELDLVDYSTASDPGGLVDNVIVDSSETITVDIGVLDVGQSATLYITATVNNSVAGPTTIANTAYLEFNEGPPRNDTASLTVPNPNTSPEPEPDDEDEDEDDDDDDDNPPPPPPPAAPQPPPAEPATLPVMFLPETGIDPAETNDWFALPLLGVMLAIYLWRITKKN